MAKEDPLCLLLLPAVVEELPYATRVHDLLRAPAIVAVEPGRLGRRSVSDSVAATQARRVAKKLPGTPRIVMLFHPAQYKLARALLANNAGCEIWYGPPESQFDDQRLADLDQLARQRAAFVFDAGIDPSEPAFRQNGELWDRLERLAIARR